MKDKRAKTVEVADVLVLFNRMKEDAKQNGVRMFDADEYLVNDRTASIFFYQFIKKYVVDNSGSKNNLVSI
jgi:hypothetical protein